MMDSQPAAEAVREATMPSPPPSAGSSGQSPRPDSVQAPRLGSGQAAAWPRSSSSERLTQVSVALGLWGVVLVSALLVPSADGLGTHEQLGMQPCTFYQATGRPCPGCGLTTAFSLMAHGRVIEAAVVQPFGALLFTLAAAGAMGASALAVAGRSWMPVLYSEKLPLVLYGLIFIWLASWCYKLIYGEVTGHYGP